MGKGYGVALLSEALSERFSPEEVTELEDVDRDAQGHIRVAEIDLGRKVKSEVQSRLEKRGVKVTVVDKTIGYELRCAPPIPYDAEHARDLGYAAVTYLMAGGSGAMITMQNGEFSPCLQRRDRPGDEARQVAKRRRRERKLSCRPRLYGPHRPERFFRRLLGREASEGRRNGFVRIQKLTSQNSPDGAARERRAAVSSVSRTAARARSPYRSCVSRFKTHQKREN